MCKGCQMSDMYGYLDNYVAHFERAASDIKYAYTWLNREAHTTKDLEKKKHLKAIVKRLKLVAKELNDIRREL